MTRVPTSFASLYHRGGTLYVNELPVLTGIADTVESTSEPDQPGLVLRFHSSERTDRLLFSLGNLENCIQFTCCHRYEPFWMKAAIGTTAGQVPIETQYLLVEIAGGVCVLFIPLIDGAFRASLQGQGESGLELVAESGDPAVVADTVTGLYIAAGADPYSLIAAAANQVRQILKTGRLREEKPLPDFVDYFGWCTWDAFYQDVSHDKVRDGLESFAVGGVRPRYLILDDGWQSEKTMPTGDRRLTGFAANEKFPGDLASTVAMSKGQYGIETFLVWHAFHGYWAGVDGESLPGYDIRPSARAYSPGILHYQPNYNHKWWGHIVGLVPPHQIYRFYQDYHRHLRLQGVDGVKVDNQASMESVAYGFGGRVELMRGYHEALEGSTHTHFLGNLINCMSCANEMIYSALNSNLTRTSTDFWPNLPDSHGRHLYVNAQVSLWFGEFVHPDWDMFQSGHAMGAFHAAGRAVGGCPIYVSDKPDEHDFALLRKLVLPDGSILRARYPGRPTRDCLFSDPTTENVLLKIFNLNVNSGIVGAFNARHDESSATVEPISGVVRPSDVIGLEGERFAVYAHNAATLRLLEWEEGWDITIPQLAFELFTVVPIDQGMAPIGLVDMFNSAGAILDATYITGNRFELVLQGGGRLLIWSERVPESVVVDGEEALFYYDAEMHTLEISTPATARNVQIFVG